MECWLFIWLFVLYSGLIFCIVTSLIFIVIENYHDALAMEIAALIYFTIAIVDRIYALIQYKSLEKRFNSMKTVNESLIQEITHIRIRLVEENHALAHIPVTIYRDYKVTI